VAQSHTLMDQLSGHVKHGDHLCVICEDPQQRLNVAAQYIADGLRQNEFVMYAADAATTDTLRQLLKQRGIDVEREIERGALNLPTAYEAYLRDGDFNPDAIYAEFDQAITNALAAGFSGCRFAGEPVWAIDRAELRPGLIEFETRLNSLFRNRQAAGLCVYDKNAWPAVVVRDVLRTHPVAVVDDLVCKSNVFYERPELLDQDTAADQQVERMLSRLRELRVHEARLQVALDAGRLGSWELDLTNDTSIRSLRHDQIFGYPEGVAEWGYRRFMQQVLPEYRDRVEAAFRQAIHHGSTCRFECRIRRHGDGSIRWIEAHGRPDPAGTTGTRVERILGIVADITERKEMEEALRDADRRKDEFLATLAHELRNPLAPICNVLQLMQLKYASDPQLQRMQGVIDRQVRHLTRLVDDLLDVSRITTGRINLRRERVELRTVLANAVEAAQPLIQASGHEFSMTLPQEPVYLLGDSTRLAQVFLNLLNNAARYTPAHGRIVVSATRDGQRVLVRVSDNGMGLPPEFIPEMFKMFVQGYRDGARAQNGLGIGLPLARQLLELHGGTIEASSGGPGQGSEFIVRLPVASGRQEDNRVADDGTIIDSGRRRILLADDNADAADSLAATLEFLGHEVSTHYDGVTALEAAIRFQPDIMLLDIGMPGMDGYQVARRMRRINPDVTLVALTGWGQEQDLRHAHDAGFDLHRTKPINPKELLAAILDPVRSSR
jgi:PAS domain S-box-containing protein